LRAHVIAGAERANPHYETLITHYDLKTGVREPTAGLNPVARDAVSALLIYAAYGFALVLDRALTEAAVEPPEVSLTAETVLATLKVPAKWITNKIADGETRRQVQAMYDELMATGRVETTLPEDDRVVRDLYRLEVVEPREKMKTAERAKRLAPASATKSQRTKAGAQPAAFAGSRGMENRSISVSDPAPVLQATPTPIEPELPTALIVPGRHKVSREALSRLDAGPRCHLLESDDLERAPSIGPKLAERLALGGIVTVADFLHADADAVVSLLGGGRFDGETVERWKTEARLVLRVPGLRGTHAQLLAGAGFETPEKLAAAEPVALSTAVLAYATTPAGMRILRNGDTPDIEAVTRWVQGAQQALAA
jgi:predicted flap endonuclease-1-like 5' DNA nuclease